MSDRKLLVYGFGGHARSVADVALCCGYTHLAFVDAQARPHETFIGHPVVSAFGDLQGDWSEAIAASGDGSKRQMQLDELTQLGFQVISLLSPRSTIAFNAKVAIGSFVGHHAHIGPGACVGRGAIVNTAAVVEHDTYVGDFAHVSVNATLAGSSRIGNFSMLGAGATVIDRITIGDHTMVGAGSVVIRSIASPGVYAGAPCKPIRKQ
ncbi:NeuD/PglB/VioB family sugar acetyltransferase [Comamonas sp. 23]|uniref:NeuD/PglB/VioB family sugar acetyltransferase n=1 Tax=Comamonas sp. 23 TaxID=3415008 RepID=UPI003C6F3E15